MEVHARATKSIYIWKDLAASSNTKQNYNAYYNACLQNMSDEQRGRRNRVQRQKQKYEIHNMPVIDTVMGWFQLTPTCLS